MKCKNCGNEHREDMAFCTNCGVHIESESATTETQPPGYPPTSDQPQYQPPGYPQTPDQPQYQPPGYPPASDQPQYQPPGYPPTPDQPQYQPPGYPPTPDQPQYQPPGYPPAPDQPQHQPPGYPSASDQPQYQPPGYSPTSNQPPGYPPPYPPLVGKQKKSKTGLIIGIVCGSVALIALIIFAVIFVSRLIIDDISYRALDYKTTLDADSGILATPIPPPPTPRPPSEVEVLPELPPPPATPAPAPPTPPPSLVSDNELVGIWEFRSGGPVYFFILSERIMFFEDEDGTLGVYESDYEEWGVVFIGDDGRMIIEGEWSGRNEFVFILDGDNLTIIDIDGDAIHYTRMG